MIKPASLWGLFKTCKSSEWVGAICRALGGQEVELDDGQANMVAVIKLDSGWMDERVEAQRERWREKKARQRGHEGDKGDKGDMSPVPQCPVTSVHPSVHPSVRPESKDSLCEREDISAHTRVTVIGTPDYSTVLEGSRLMGVAEWYAAWWWKNMEASGWRKTNGDEVNLTNWRAVLKAWWNRADERERARIQAELKEADIAGRKAEEREDTNPAHWKGCAGCGNLYVCGYMCKHAKVPPKDPKACRFRDEVEA